MQKSEHRKVKPKKRNKLTIKIPRIYIVLSIFSYVLSAYLMFSDKGIFTYINQRRQIAELQRQIEEVRRNIQNVEERKRLITSGNRDYLESVFRRFGWMKEGEKILKISE